MLVEIKFLDWVIDIFMPVVLFYRRIRFGFAFRRIRLTEGRFAIIDPEDYKKISAFSWHLNIHKYACAFEKVNGKRTIVSMHRKLIKISPGFVVDHINQNRIDNRKSNLRPATLSQNAHNKITRPHSSRFRGVSWERGKRKWVARFGHNGKEIYLGSFTDEVEAAKTYDRAVKKYHGEFASPNFRATAE